MSIDVDDIISQSDWDNTQDQTPPDMPVKEGWYTLEVEKAEVRENKSNSGHHVWVQFRVQGPEHANQCVFDQYNVDNPSKRAQKIGMEQFKALGTALGFDSPPSVREIQGGRVHGLVKIRENEYGGETSYENRVTAFQPAEGQPDGPKKNQPAPYGKSTKKNGKTSNADVTPDIKTTSYDDDEVPF